MQKYPNRNGSREINVCKTLAFMFAEILYASLFKTGWRATAHAVSKSVDPERITKMKRMSAFAASVVAMGFYTAPVGAQITGTIQGLSQGTVVCVNSTDPGTGVVTGPITAGSFVCSGLSTTPGDIVTIVITAPAGEGGPILPPGTGCSTPVPEQEPNDDFPQSQDVGTLQSGGCIAVAGSTDVGFGNPDAPDDLNADFDYYLFSLAGVSRVRIDFDLAAAQTLRFSIFDADTQARLEDQGPPEAIEVAVPAQTSRIIFRMSTDVPDSYTLTFSDQSGTGSPPLGALTRGLRLIEQRP
jgi:hypothetical protein